MVLVSGAAARAAVNVPEDTDQDGDPDYVLCGDFDGDGFHRPSDIQACNDALTDTGARHVEVVAEVFDIPHTGFSPPANGLIRPSAGTRISCLPGARIVGVDERYLVGGSVAVFFVDQPDVSIGPDCEIDGGFPDPLDCSVVSCPSGELRMGVFGSAGSTNLVVEGNTIHHTGHACVYLRNDANRSVRNNELYRCGGTWDSSGTVSRFPGVYVYNDDALSPTLATEILDNDIHGTQGISLRTRGNEAGQVVQDVTITGNTIFDTQGADGSWGPCFGIGGVRELFIGANLCQNAGVVVFRNRAPDFYDSPDCTRPIPVSGCLDAVHDVTIDGLTLQTIHGAPNGGALGMGSYADLVQLRNVEIRDVLDGGCFHFGGPLRDFDASDLTCERAAFGIAGPSDAAWWPGKNGPSDAIHVDRFTLSGIDEDLDDGVPRVPLDFPLGLEHSSFVNGSITGFGRYAFEVGGGRPVANNSFVAIDIDQLFPAHLGNAFVADLGSGGLACQPGLAGSFVTVLDATAADCAAPGSSATICYCDGSAWQPAAGDQLHSGGSAFYMAGAQVAANEIRDVRVRVSMGNDALRLADDASGNLVDGVLLEDTVITSRGEVAVAGLPAASALAECWIVPDAAGSDDCSVGGGTQRNLCCWNGSAWDGSLGGQGAAFAGQGVDSKGAPLNTIRNVECTRTHTANIPCRLPQSAGSGAVLSLPALGSWARLVLACGVGWLGAFRVRRGLRAGTS